MHTCDAAAPAKNVFGVDLTEDENNTRLDGACFVTARVDAAQEASLERALQAAQAVESTTRLPWPLRWGKTGAAALALLFVYLSSLFFSEDDPLFLPEARFCLAGAAGFGLLYGLLRLAARRRSRRVRKSEALRPAPCWWRRRCSPPPQRWAFRRRRKR